MVGIGGGIGLLGGIRVGRNRRRGVHLGLGD